MSLPFDPAVLQDIAPDLLNKVISSLPREQKEELARALHNRKHSAELDKARNSLVEYCCLADPNADQEYQAKVHENPYRTEHLQLISKALERVEKGELKRLMIFTPPRHWKSSITSDKFPQYCLGRHPEWPIIIVSHTLALSEKFSTNIRDTVANNTIFRELFPDTILREDKRSADDWSTTRAYRSSVRAVGMSGNITGHGARLIIIDDPVKDEAEAFSVTAMNHQWDWYQYTLTSRVEEETAIVLMMTRWVENDLAGRLIYEMKQGGEKWEIIRIPRVAESQEQRDRIAFRWGLGLGEPDPLGRPEGQRLWPERFSQQLTDTIKKTAGSRGWSALHQQTPQSEEGRILDSAYLKRIKASDLPPMIKRVRRWDLAFSEKHGADYTTGALCGKDKKGNKYILDMKRLRGGWTKNKAEIIESALKDGAGVTCIIESNGTQKGYYQDIRDEPKLKGKRLVIEDIPEGDKAMRASMWGSHLVDGEYYLVEGAWNDELTLEMDSFPSLHDDQVDALSGAFKALGYSSAPRFRILG